MSFWKKIFGGKNRQKAEALVQQGYLEARKGRYREALQRYTEATAADDSFALGWLNKALCQQDMFNARARRLDDAEQTERLLAIADDLERALALDDALVKGWRCLGHVSRRLTHYLRAEEAFERVLELAEAKHPHREEAAKELEAIRPRAALARARRAVEAVAADGEADEAALLAALEQAEPLLHPERFADEAEGGQGAEGLERRAKAPAAAEPLDASFRWAVAVLCRRLGQAEGAKEQLAAILEVDPGHLGALRDLATLALDEGDVGRALEHSLAAYHQDPLDAALVCNVGVCHLSLGQLDQAGEFLRMALDLAPKDPIVARAWSAYQEQARA